MKIKRYVVVFILMLAILPLRTANAYELVLPDENYFLYGDFQSYSLPILAYVYDSINGGGVGPGNPYYIASTPGTIKDYVVVGTGSSGKPVTTNFAGMDDAYPTPNKSTSSSFSTETTVDPGQTPTLINDYSTSWDSNLLAFTGFLDGGNPVFFFNNNEENSDGGAQQTLLAWGQLSLTGAGVDPVYFDLTNNPASFEGNPYTDYTSPGYWDPGSFDYVISGGQVCINASGIPQNCDGSEVDTYGPIAEPINHNLGANQAAYAIISPELNDWLDLWLAGSYSGYETLSLRFMFENIDNGYEQVFIASTERLTPVPEPSTIVLLLAGVCGLFAFQRRKRN